MSTIQFSNVTFSYGGQETPLFDDLNLILDDRWRTGLIGRNGRGKSSLLRLLTSQLEYTGNIEAPQRFVCFPLENLPGEMNGRDAVLSCLPELEEWRLQREMNHLSLPEEVLERPLQTLSPGEQTKLQLAALFALEDCFPLIDEPTTHLDQHGREKLANYLAGKSGFILVSHDRRVLDQAVDHIVAINRSGVEVQQGNFSSWAENRARQDAHERDENDRLRKDIRRLDQAARRTAGWSDAVERSKIGEHALDRGFIGAQSARMMQRAKNVKKRQQSAIEEKKGLLRDVEESETLKIAPLHHHAELLLQIEDLTIRYDGAASCFEHLDFIAKNGERIAVTGANGCGKSSLLRLIAGELVPHQGRIVLASGLILSVLPQRIDGLRGSAAVYARQIGVDVTQMFTVLRKLGFPREAFDIDMQQYSSGQRKKALLAGSLCQKAHLYIWDEPLNFIDLLSREQIESLLLEAKPSLLFVEHDAAFVDAIATRTLAL